jgi:uncharacterized membrane protein YadS
MKNIPKKYVVVLYGFMLVVSLFTALSPAWALLIGIVFAAFGLKIAELQSYISQTLQISIVMMGFGMSLTQVLEASKEGLIDTAFSVVLSVFERQCSVFLRFFGRFSHRG